MVSKPFQIGFVSILLLILTIHSYVAVMVSLIRQIQSHRKLKFYTLQIWISLHCILSIYFFGCPFSTWLCIFAIEFSQWLFVGQRANTSWEILKVTSRLFLDRNPPEASEGRRGRNLQAQTWLFWIGYFSFNIQWTSVVLS